MATGHNLLSRQMECSPRFWSSEHPFYVLFPSHTSYRPRLSTLADLSRPQLEESWAAGRGGPVTTAAHRCLVAELRGLVLSLRSSGRCICSSLTSHSTFCCPNAHKRRRFFPWQRAINSGFLCAYVDSFIFQHDRTLLFCCKHLCFIRFILFLFFYFELYTFGK